jgi:hypothetical protein
MNDEASVSMSSMLDLLFDQERARTWHSMPARVESYDKVRQKISAQPLIKREYSDDLGDHAERLPIVPDVPVVFFGSGGYSDTVPVTRGDTVLLVFASQSLDRWLVRGGVVEPGIRGGLADAVAFIGLRDFAHPIPADGIAENARVMRVPTGHQLRLGSATATQSMLLGEAFLTALGVLLDAIAAGVGGGGGAAIAAAITVFEAAAPGYKSLKVKAQ